MLLEGLEPRKCQELRRIPAHTVSLESGWVTLTYSACSLKVDLVEQGKCHIGSFCMPHLCGWFRLGEV